MLNVAYRRGRRCDPPAPLYGVYCLWSTGKVWWLTSTQPHSASKNHLRIPRFITNPPVTLKEPLNLNRANPEEYVSPSRTFRVPGPSLTHALNMCSRSSS